MLFLVIAFMLVVDAVESKFSKAVVLFSIALVFGIAGLLMVLSDKPLAIQWLIAWMTRP